MNRLILFLLFGACMTLPFSYQVSTIFLMVFSGSTILSGILHGTGKQKGVLVKLLYLPSLFFILIAVGTIFSPFKENAFKLWIKYLPFLIVSLAYVFSGTEIKKEAPKYISAGVIVGVTAVLLFLFGKVGIEFIQSGEKNWLRLFSFEYTYNRFLSPLDMHPTYLAILIIVSNYFVYNFKKVNKAVRILLLLFNAIGIFFVMSRVGIIIFFFQVALLFFFLDRKKKIVYGISMVIIVLATGLLYQFQLRHFYVLQRLSLELTWDLNPTNVDSEINNRVADDSRIARWSTIIQAIEKKPVLGYGVGSEKSVLYDIYGENDLIISQERQYNTHNQFLFFLLETGIIGFFVFLAYFIVNVKYAFDKNDIFLFLFLFTVFFACLFENYLNRTMGILAVSIFLTFMRTLEKE